jgi:putative ABC transport system ATP-binding protein
MSRLIETRDLERVYTMGESEVRALDGVSLNIEAGEFVALMGPSGSGKSTLMHILGCLDRPTAGRYLLEGEEIGQRSDDELARLRNRRIGFVFQNFNLLPRANALENAGLPLLYDGDVADWREKAAHALERVGMGHRREHRPAQLSGGECQRIAIARALVKGPTLILADEPTGNLDSARSREIMGLLSELVKEGRTILMVTHDAATAEYADRRILFRDGRITQAEGGK